MYKTTSLESWNEAVICLVDALLGAISPNFRMIALAENDEGWLLRFFLEMENDLDREEILDVGTQFEVRYSSAIKYGIEIVIGAEELAWPDAPSRVVYKRREN